MEWLAENFKQIIILGLLIIIAYNIFKRVKTENRKSDKLIEKYKELPLDLLNSLEDGELLKAVIANHFYVEGLHGNTIKDRYKKYNWSAYQQNVYFVWIVTKQLLATQAEDKKDKAFSLLEKTLRGQTVFAGEAFNKVGAAKAGEIFLKMESETYDRAFHEELLQAVNEEKPLELCPPYIKAHIEHFEFFESYYYKGRETPLADEEEAADLSDQELSDDIYED